MKYFNNSLLALCAGIFLSGCAQQPHFMENKGPVYGTFYSVVYEGENDYGAAFDSIFNKINNAVSNYRDNSEISRFNTRGFLENPSPIFLEQLESAFYYHKITNGAFEPTLLPIIEAWGFGLKERTTIAASVIDSLLPLVSFSKNISYSKDNLKSHKDGTQLSLTSLGEGYTLNKIAAFLEEKGVKNYKVELGGEVKCKGQNEDGKVWKIGIANPYYDLGKSDEQLIGILELEETSLSTSGSYRKFYVDENGRKRSHIIDPKTGYPVTHNLLSVSIKCKNAEKADALATACMVMGQDKAEQFITENEDIEGFLIFENRQQEIETWASEGFFSKEIPL